MVSYKTFFDGYLGCQVDDVALAKAAAKRRITVNSKKTRVIFIHVSDNIWKLERWWQSKMSHI